MIHSYSGSYEQAIKLIDLDFFMSFGGAITYEKSTRLRKTAAAIPLECLLVETDAPDQPVAQSTSPTPSGVRAVREASQSGT